MNPTNANYVLIQPGETPDTTRAQPFAQAAAVFLKRAETEPNLGLHDLETGITYTTKNLDDIRLVYLMQTPATDLAIRSADGATIKPVADLRKAVEELTAEKSNGLYVPGEDLWLIAPSAQNPHFDQQVEMLGEELKADQSQVFRAQPADSTGKVASPEAYPVETSDDLDLLPGLTGEKMLNATVNFLGTASPAKLAVLGALAGMVAYKSMGIKGVVGLLLAVAALKRYVKMGNRILMDERIDVVARGIQEGVPTGKDGQVTPEFLEALRHLPAGDHHLESRRINPTILARPWGKHPFQEPQAPQLDSFPETIREVMDGDTFSGEHGGYRLIGIDTPELVRGGSSQPGARAAWENLRSLIPPGSQVRVEVAPNQPALYGRTPCYLYARDPSTGSEFCVNQWLVEEGLARVTDHAPYHSKTREFVQASLDAISHRRGLWNALYNPVSQPKLVAIDAERQMSSGGERFTVSLA